MVIYYNEDKTYYTEKLDMFMVLSVWWLRCYSAETTYLKPSSHFLLHLNFDGGKKTFFPSPSHFLPSAFVQEPD